MDSQDRVYVYSRSEHPLVVFDREGNFLTSWGEGILKDAHGIFIDSDDNIYCVEWNIHIMRKFTSDGKLLMTLGTPDVPGKEGDPFNLPTDIALSPEGDMYISDGYGNSRVHKYSADGKLLFSWGEPGNGSGQFDLPHSVWVDKKGRVFIADRENNRIQIFDPNGKYVTEWTGFLQPDDLYFDADETVYVAELGHRVSILNTEGEVLARWGEKSGVPGQFLACPHGIWADSHGDLYVVEVQGDHRIQKFVRKH